MSQPEVADSAEADRFGWHYRRSLASRVTLLATIAVALAVSLVSVGAYVTVRQQLQESLDRQLVDRARAAADYEFVGQLTEALDFPTWALGAADLRIALLRSDGFPIGPPEQASFTVGRPELAVARGQDSLSVRTVNSDGTDFRVVAVPLNVDGWALVVAQSLDEQHRLLSRLGFVSLLFGGLGVLVAGVAGWVVARNGLRPVRTLTAAAEEIARTEELRPMPIEGDDEVARLSAAFNQMLAALGASRERQRRLVADAGHELRTPLTSLRTNVDLLTQADATVGGSGLEPQARAELLDDIRAQIDELTTLIGDLTELSRDEPLTPVVEPVEMGELLDHAVQRVRRRAPGVTFDTRADPWWLVGETAALERAVTNVLDNAAKWSPPGGTVTARLAEGVLTVDDEGPGIKEADRPHVFERFWRAEESRTMPGSGLGLSIVAQVAERHSGRVEVGTSPAGGTRLTLTLPGSEEPGD
jgi:two-component system, OmpR family, sensor histidine kinase MprB